MPSPFGRIMLTDFELCGQLMSTLLALETSTNACSAALRVDGQLYQRSVVAPREHAERILGMVQELIEEAAIPLSKLDGIAFGQGPGSFLGTRIAAGVAQGLGFALNIPLFPVSSLQALAQAAVDNLSVTEVIAAWDARLGSFYWGHYRLEDGRLQSVTPDAISKPADFVLPADSPQLVGNAWGVYQAEFKQNLPPATERYPEAAYLLPEAEYMLTQGQGVDAAEAGPIYLRDPV